jgi:hypothetical protein
MQIILQDSAPYSSKSATAKELKHITCWKYISWLNKADFQSPACIIIRTWTPGATTSETEQNCSRSFPCRSNVSGLIRRVAQLILGI